MPVRMDDVDALSRLSGGGNAAIARLYQQYSSGTGYQLSRNTQQYLYRQYGILKKLVNIPPNQMTFRWGTLTLGGKDGDTDIREGFERITKRLPIQHLYSKSLGVSAAFNLAQKAANKTGNGAILLDLDDGGDLRDPVDLEKLKKIKGLYVLNRWSIQPQVIGGYMDRGFYRLTGGTSSRTIGGIAIGTINSVHESRILWFRGEELDDEELVRTGGVDDCVFQSVLSSFFDYRDAVCGARDMIKDFDIFVHSVQGLLTELAHDAEQPGEQQGDYEKLLNQRIESNDNHRRVHRTMLIDKEMEGIAHSTRQVSGYSDLMDRVLNDFLANVELTPSELLGKYPEGMADTGKVEQQNANDRTARYQREKFYANIIRFCEVLFQCKEGPTKGKIPEVWDFAFEPLYPTTPVEDAELQLNYAQINDANIRNGVYTSDDVAKSQYGGPEFQPNITIDFKAREKAIAEQKALAEQQQQAAPADGEAPPEDAGIEELLKGYQADAVDSPRMMPPPEVRSSAAAGIKIYDQNRLKSALSLTPLSRKLASGAPVEGYEVRAMHLFFMTPKWRKVSTQSPSEGHGAIVWAMMGGDVGDAWSGAIVREMNRRSDGVRMDKPCGRGFIADWKKCSKDPVNGGSGALKTSSNSQTLILSRPDGERRWLASPTLLQQYGHPPDAIHTGAFENISLYVEDPNTNGLIAAARAYSVDINQAVHLNLNGGSPPFDVDNELRWRKEALPHVLPSGGTVLIQAETPELKEVAERMGLSKVERLRTPVARNLSTPENLGELKELVRPEYYNSLKSAFDDIYVGEYRDGKINKVSTKRAEDIDRIPNLRYQQFYFLERNEFNRLNLEDELGRPVKVTEHPNYKKNLAKEDEAAKLLSDHEDRVIGRSPTKIGSYAVYRRKGLKWSEETFGKQTQGANGFTLKQTLAHDISHPIVHEMLGTDSKGIAKRFQSATKSAKVPSIISEEAIVNVAEHLSRGDSIEGSIINGARLARVLSRSASREEKDMVLSRKFLAELAKMSHEMYRHNNFSLYMAHIRKSNRISRTVTASGTDFTNSASGG